jgi:hypothetical protein
MNNLQKKIGSLTAFLVSIIAFSSPANALTFTIFTNEAAFRTASGSLSTETFNSFTTDTSFNPGPVALTDFRLTSFGTLSPPSSNRNRIDVPTLAAPILNINGTAQIDGITSNTNSFGFNVIFKSPITAFGATFNGISDLPSGTPATTRLRVGADVVTPFIPSIAQGSTGFYGFIASGNFSTITFEAASTNASNDVFGADNFLYTSVTPVPFEFSPALGVGVLGGLWAVRKVLQK